MENKSCEHCYPERRCHIRRKAFSFIDHFMFSPFIYVLSKTFLISENSFLLFDNLLSRLFINIFQKLKLITKTNIIDRNQFNKSLLALWDEGQRRGLELYNFKERNIHTLYFILVFNKKKYYYLQTPISIIYQKNKCFDNDIKYDNKWAFKKKLLTNKIPCPEGKIFISRRKAYNFGIKLGFPLVVKPISASLSIHVLCNIQTPKELEQAIRIVKQVDYRVLIEKHIPGDVFRALIINDSLIDCVMRQPESVIGDGVCTIQELIDKKMPIDDSLCKTLPDSYLRRVLEDQCVTIDTVLNVGQQIFISKKVTIGSGGKITNASHLIHPENKLLLERTHKILNIPLTGLDFICKDVSLPWYKQPFGIIENNSFPYIDLHLTPSDEKRSNVPSKIWDYVLGVLDQKNIGGSIKED